MTEMKQNRLSPNEVLAPARLAIACGCVEEAAARRYLLPTCDLD